MKLREFSLLADESLPAAVVDYLRQQGSDVFDVKEQALLGAADIDLIRLAHAQNRVLLTHDRDFGHLAIAMMEPMVGIVYLRPGHIDPEFTISSLRALLEEDPDLSPPFVIVVEHKGKDIRIRVRRY